LFASGGPCYYTVMTGSNYFSGQMSYLRLANEQYTLPALTIQDMLLKTVRYQD
jgi:indole-3-glycerol phosphate synthase